MDVEFRQGLDIPEHDGSSHMVIILDDLMCEVVQSPVVQSLFTEGSHHKKITVIFLLQNLISTRKTCTHHNVKQSLSCSNEKPSRHPAG